MSVNRLSDNERGWVLVVAMVVMALMLSIGLGAMAFVDQQQVESGKQRTREAAFNLSEGVLTGELYLLSRNWPGTAAGAYPQTCDQASTGSTTCPNNAKIASRFNSVDFSGTGNYAWSVLVVDNGSFNGTSLASFYDDTAAQGLAAQSPTQRWDANNDGQVWVRSSGTARGRQRILVARVRIESAKVEFPQNAVTAGRIHVITNNGGNGGANLCPGTSGQPPIVCTASSSSSGAAPIVVRCVSPTYNSDTKDAHDWANGGNHCLDWQTGQVAPLNEVHCGTGSSVNHGCTPAPASASASIPSEALDALRDTASTQGTYCNADGTSNPTFCTTTGSATGCPTKPGLTAPSISGKTVFIEKTPLAGCSYTSNANETVFPNSPGYIVIASGAPSCSNSASAAFSIGGSFTINGLVYSANLQGWSGQPSCGVADPANIAVDGNARIVGAVALDADGLLEVNANANNVLYNPVVFQNFSAFGTAGIIQNTWRQLK